MTEDETVGWHHRLNGRKFGQRGRVCAVLGGRMAPGRRWRRAMAIGARGCQGGCCQEQSLLQHPWRRGRGQGETGEFQEKGAGNGDPPVRVTLRGSPAPGGGLWAPRL